MSHNNSTCSHCGKPLNHLACIACEGTGFIRELAFIKRNCAVCHGSRRVWRCEDEFKHIVDDFKASHPAEPHHPTPLPTPRHIRGSQELSPTESTPWHSIHPENPWNLNALHIPVIPGSSPSAKHTGQRSTGKTSHKK